MAYSVIMPRQGQSVESCIITAWHKKKGDKVAEGEDLFSYETDKSAFDEKSLYSGTLLEILAQEGDVVPCLDAVCIIGEEGEDISALIGADASAAEDSAAPAEPESPAVTAPAAAVTSAPEEDGGKIVRISPRAKKLALTTGADLSEAAPTGPHGRIIERDVTALLDQGKRSGTAAVEDFLAGKLPASGKAQEPQAPFAADTAAHEEYTDVPMSGIRRAIARSMQASLNGMAQLTLNSSFDASAILEYRKKLKASDEEMGLSKISLNDMVFYAVSRTLPGFPEINATLTDDTLRQYAHANIGLAVDTPRGLLVPTVPHADEMSLAQISAANKFAAAKARDGALTPDEMSGASFTVTNLGSLGVESFTPVINPPQVAILGVCSVQYKLKADGSTYPAMGLSLTFDHRAVDGAPAAKFLAALCRNLAAFDMLLAK